MHDLAPGRIIGGRFLLDALRTSEQAPVQTWTATDRDSGATVTVTLLSADSPLAATAQDAARRATVVADPRLTQVLDVGTTDGLAWIVEEDLPAGRSLPDLVSGEALRGEEARTLIGEAAGALALAAERGLHHLRLTPYDVAVTADGGLKIRGLGTAHAVADTGAEPDAGRANLLDTVGILALGYYALTTRWPLPREVAGLTPAPRVVGGVPAPSEIAAGVPADLDMLCRTTLNGLPGPTTPAQLAAEVAPWRPRLRPVAPRTDVLPQVEQAADELVVPAPATPDLPPPEATDLPGLDPAAAPEPTSAPAPTAALPDLGLAAAAPPAVPATSATGEAPDAASSPTARLGSFARAAADKAALRRAEADARRADEQVSLTDIRQEPHAYEPAGPLTRVRATEPPGTHSTFVLTLVAAVVVVAFVLATMTVVRAIRGGTPAAGTTTKTTAAAPAVPVVPQLVDVPIISDTIYDPFGDGTENNNTVRRARDGDPATGWKSEEYYDAKLNWGGADNRGVGVVFGIAPGSVVRSATLTFGPGAQSADLYVNTRPDTQGATKIGTVSKATGTVEVPITAGPPAAFVIVWFTDAPKVGGFYQASLNEILLKG